MPSWPIAVTTPTSARSRKGGTGEGVRRRPSPRRSGRRPAGRRAGPPRARRGRRRRSSGCATTRPWSPSATVISTRSSSSRSPASPCVCRCRSTGRRAGRRHRGPRRGRPPDLPPSRGPAHRPPLAPALHRRIQELGGARDGRAARAGGTPPAGCRPGLAPPRRDRGTASTPRRPTSRVDVGVGAQRSSSPPSPSLRPERRIASGSGIPSSARRPRSCSIRSARVSPAKCETHGRPKSVLSRWQCASTSPGSTRQPVASTVSSAGSAAPAGTTASARPPLTTTSHGLDDSEEPATRHDQVWHQADATRSATISARRERSSVTASRSGSLTTWATIASSTSDHERRASSGWP